MRQRLELDTIIMPCTGFPETEAYMRRHLRHAVIEEASLQRPLSRCEMAECRGACCHDGAVIGREEARVIEALCAEEETFFAECGIDFDRNLIEPENWRREPDRIKTATRPREEQSPHFPDHFPRTACVFLTEDHLCGLQLLSVARGRHPWFWKPFSCWLHPLAFDERQGCRLLLHSQESDPLSNETSPGFVVYTDCGATCTSGRPARDVLAEELAFLGAVLGREL